MRTRHHSRIHELDGELGAPQSSAECASGPSRLEQVRKSTEDRLAKLDAVIDGGVPANALAFNKATKQETGE